ncbi:hypothetical protein A6X21_00535 [Planctopirus hydrillae]|uniref:Uncharacterized protein n=2 Tax=Planctopirus hydrillae TaxID=1841610 RepID=A0A1C3EB20_9PLAN|nr:hypothetical protein A6X21_00535 [Planctopirus hydrillae]
MKSHVSVELVDLLGMPSQLIGQQPELRRLLESYQPQKLANGVTETWIPRISILECMEPAALSAGHGKLIAWGLIRFELAEAQHGLRYQLTPEGRQALGYGLSVVSSETADDESHEELTDSELLEVSGSREGSELASV